jgi:hypothetical protein
MRPARLLYHGLTIIETDTRGWRLVPWSVRSENTLARAVLYATSKPPPAVFAVALSDPLNRTAATR